MATKSTKSTTEKKKTAPAAANVSESKAAPAEKPAEKVFTLAEVQEMIKAAIAESQKDAPARIVYAKDAEQITLCYTGPMAKGTVYSMPGIGSINRQFGYITVSKEPISPVLVRVPSGKITVDMPSTNSFLTNSTLCKAARGLLRSTKICPATAHAVPTNGILRNSFFIIHLKLLGNQPYTANTSKAD